MAKRRLRDWIGRHWKPLSTVYLLVLLASHLVIAFRPETEDAFDQQRRIVEIDGKRLSYVEWGGDDARRTPLILIHGSPGRGARDWEKFGPALASDGRRVLAVDRWGYGDSQKNVEDYSFMADTRAVIGLMDQLGIPRAHVGGWSYGGGPAIILGELHPDRIRSVLLISAIGIQKGEGSGSYMVEHAKYGLGFLLFVGLPEVIPHFGALGPRAARYAFVRDFWDCDQRSLELRLQTLQRPLFIIHGQDDPLIASWVAQDHHRIQPNSRLVVLDGSHFYPFGFKEDGNFALAAEEVRGFLAATDAKVEDKWFAVRNLTEREDLRALWNGGPPLRGYKPWWLVAFAGLIMGLFLPRSGAAVAGFGGALLIFDLATGLGGVLLGSLLRVGESTRWRNFAWVIAVGLLAAVPGAILLPFL